MKFFTQAMAEQYGGGRKIAVCNENMDNLFEAYEICRGVSVSAIITKRGGRQFGLPVLDFADLRGGGGMCRRILPHYH